MTKRTFPLLWIALFFQLPGATPAGAAVSIGVEAHDLKLVKGTGRVWKFPDGWLCRMLDQGEMQQADFALPQTLQPGEFTVFVKARNGGADARVSCGGATSEELVFDGAWSQPFVLAVKTPAQTMTVTAKNKSTTAVNCILQALYITDRKNVAIGGADCVVAKLEAAPTDPSPAVPGNLVPNSSFEVGLGQGWLFAVPGLCFKTPGDRLVDYHTQSIWDKTAGYHGNASPNANTFAYVFDRGGTALAAVFAASKENMMQRTSLTLALAPGQFKAYDLMGNELPPNGSAVFYGRQPVYIEGVAGLSAEALRAAISQGVVQNVADKTAPAVSICDAPRGVIPVRSAFIRWIALDDTACPIQGSFGDAIEYSYRLLGRDPAWSPWTARIYEFFEDLAPGEYRFEVQAKNASGNVSEVVSREFTVAESGELSPESRMMTRPVG